MDTCPQLKWCLTAQPDHMSPPTKLCRALASVLCYTVWSAPHVLVPCLASARCTFLEAVPLFHAPSQLTIWGGKLPSPHHLLKSPPFGPKEAQPSPSPQIPVPQMRSLLLPAATQSSTWTSWWYLPQKEQRTCRQQQGAKGRNGTRRWPRDEKLALPTCWCGIACARTLATKCMPHGHVHKKRPQPESLCLQLWPRGPVPAACSLVGASIWRAMRGNVPAFGVYQRSIKQRPAFQVHRQPGWGWELGCILFFFGCHVLMQTFLLKPANKSPNPHVCSRPPTPYSALQEHHTAMHERSFYGLLRNDPGLRIGQSPVQPEAWAWWLIR